MNAPIVFMDTETCGLRLSDPIWEFAAIRREADGSEMPFHCFIEHDVKRAELMPEEFRIDHDTRYDPDEALSQEKFVGFLQAVFSGPQNPHVVGAVPSFDTARIDHQFLIPRGLPSPWHYHLHDVENVAVGWLRALEVAASNSGFGSTPDLRRWLPPHSSDDISAALGVDPEWFERHTAMGDVLWIKAQWDVIFA